MALRKQHVVVLAVVAIFAVILLAVIASEPAGSQATDDGVVTRVLQAGEGDGVAAFPLVLTEGDPEHESSHVFEALAGEAGVVRASLEIATEELTVHFDSAQTSEAEVRSVLVAAGYVAPSVEDAVPAVLSEDGSVQRLGIADDHGFDPPYILAKAGVPIELEFEPGTECRTSVTLPPSGATYDISSGAVVTLPALDPGTYPILCSGNAQEAVIIVQ